MLQERDVGAKDLEEIEKRIDEKTREVHISARCNHRVTTV